MKKLKILPAHILVVLSGFAGIVLIVRSVLFWETLSGSTSLRIIINGWHIHHFATGFLLVLFALLEWRAEHRWRFISLMVLGIGMGLMFDEFLFWTHFRFEYWHLSNFFGVLFMEILLIAFYMSADKHRHHHIIRNIVLPVTLSALVLFTFFTSYGSVALR